MTNIELKNLVLDLQDQINAIKSSIADLHLLYATKLQWKELDRLREQEISDINKKITSLNKDVTLLQNQ